VVRIELQQHETNHQRKVDMTKDELLCKALKALEDMDILFSHLSQDCTAYNAVDRAREAITAIKQAISAPVQEPVVRWDSDGWGDLLVDSLPDGTLLYTTPPAAHRQWVGLTDEEIEKLRQSFATRYAIEAIEAKLREKNT
jgi:hypothetical protein